MAEGERSEEARLLMLPGEEGARLWLEVRGFRPEEAWWVVDGSCLLGVSAAVLRNFGGWSGLDGSGLACAAASSLAALTALATRALDCCDSVKTAEGGIAPIVGGITTRGTEQSQLPSQHLAQGESVARAHVWLGT